MADRFEEMARKITLYVPRVHRAVLFGEVLTALRAESKRGQEAMRERAAALAADADDSDERDNGIAATRAAEGLDDLIRNLPIEE